MNGKDKLGLTALVLALLGGAWLTTAPWIVDYRPRGSDWSTGVTNEFWLGVCVVAVAFAGLVGYTAAGLRELAKAKADTPDPS